MIRKYSPSVQKGAKPVGLPMKIVFCEGYVNSAFSQVEFEKMALKA